MLFALGMFFGISAVAASSAPHDAQALLAEARAQASAGQTADAIHQHRLAASVMPRDVGARRELARLLARTAKTRREAEKVYAEAAAIAPTDAELATERAANLVALGDGVNAVIEYRRAFELAPDSSAAASGFVQQVSRLGALSVAIKQISRKLSTAPDDIAARLLLAELLRSEAQYDDALDHFWLAGRAAPNNPVVLRGVAQTWLALGFPEQAQEYFVRLAAAHPNRGQALADQAQVLIAEEQPEAALRVLSTQQSAAEQHPAALLAMADAYRALGKQRTQQERAALEKLVALGSPPEIILALERLARVSFEMTDKQAVQNACTQLLMLDPKNAVGMLGLKLISATPAATSTSTTTDGEGAAAEEVSPTRRAGHNQAAGEAALFWNQAELARPLLKQALASRPDSPRLLLAFGTALLQTNDVDGAAATFAHVVIASGQRPDALLKLAEAELARHDAKRALTIYRNVLRLDATNMRALLGQAEVLKRSGDDKQVAVLLTDLVRRAPESTRLNDQLREAFSALGRSYRSNSASSSSESLSPHSNVSLISTVPSPAVGQTPLPAVEPVLHNGDGVRVRVVGRPEFGAEVHLDNKGLIQLPFLKPAINARCLTERQLRAEIIKQGTPQLANTNIEVAITEYQGVPLIVAGAVYLPGRFNVRKPVSLRESLMLASGANPQAGGTVYVMRGAAAACDIPSASPARSAAKVETYNRAAVEEQGTSLKRPLQAGDIVIVPESEAAFVTGAVQQPGTVAVSGRLTLLAAIENSGGTLPEARRDQVRLRRLLPDGSMHQDLVVSLAEIEQRRVGDVVLQSGDIVEVLSVTGEDTARSFANLLRRVAFDTQLPMTPPIPLPQVVVTSESSTTGQEKQQ